MARVSTEVCTVSGLIPDWASSRPPFLASCAPTSDRATSTQPVNRPLAFHSLSPCRSSTRVFMVLELIGVWEQAVAGRGCLGRAAQEPPPHRDHQPAPLP